MTLNVLKTTAVELQALQENGTYSCVQIVRAFYEQIQRHNAYLKAIIEIIPRNVSERRAKDLDDERRNGKVRGPLHGIPVIVKDTFNTGPELGVNTTCGSFAFVDSKPYKNATVIQRAIDAGMVVIAKANVSELGYFKGSSLVWGWSAVGGQAQSPYHDGDVDDEEGVAGHSNPGGSSTGCGSAVAAGLAPVSIGADFNGSLTNPATRAALYCLRSSPGMVSEMGCYPYSRLLDTIGPMAKCVEDCVNVFIALVDGIHEHAREGGYGSGTRLRWKDMSIGTLDPDFWRFRSEMQESTERTREQISNETRAAYARLHVLAKKVHDNVDLIHGGPLSDIKSKGQAIIYSDFPGLFETYIKTLETPKVRSVRELVEFNITHKDKELPEDYDDQDHLEHMSSAEQLSDDAYEKLWSASTLALRSELEKTFKEHSIDLILGPADSDLPDIVGFSGFCSATLPLSYLADNGRPFGLLAIARPHQELFLIDFMREWESTFPPRKVPKNF